MQITNTRVYGLEESIVASGYPMSVDIFKDVVECIYAFDVQVSSVIASRQRNTAMNNKHFKRACKLAKSKNGSGHDCFLKGIIVQMDVKAPQYFWQQLQRYHFIDIISSQSKMHMITKFDLYAQANDKTLISSINNAKDAIDEYNTGQSDIDDVLCNIPMGFEYTARLTTNYLQLKTIYAQRKTHRSKQWKEFCKWIKTLPLAKEFIVNDENENG